jgi:transcriptional accessory protein Tex/SPT6
MHTSEDSDAIVDALAYVEQLHRELTTENGAPPLGAQNRVAEAILADPALVAYVRDWAARHGVQEASMAPARRLPIDDVYRRLSALLLRNETSPFA